MSGLTNVNRRKVSADYLNLVRTFPLRKIQSEEGKSAAVQILGRILGRPSGRMSEGEKEYVGVLGRLVEDFGRLIYPSLGRSHSPLQILRYLMEENKMNADALGKVLGNKTAASLVLNGKRELSKSHIRKLAKRFKLDPGIFF